MKRLLVVLTLAAGCAGTTPPQPGSAVDTGATPAGKVACEYAIPPSMQDAARQALELVLGMDAAVVAIDMVNPAGVIAQASPAFYALAWETVHAALALSGVSDAAAWTAASQRIFREFAAGCRDGLPRVA